VKLYELFKKVGQLSKPKKKKKKENGSEGWVSHSTAIKYSFRSCGKFD
jgi:hypothetical protein